MSLASGSRLGPYEIRSPLGAGGMGEVYRAQDPRLGREVAIKVLPGEFSQDAERPRCRFGPHPRSRSGIPSRSSNYVVRPDGRFLIVLPLDPARPTLTFIENPLAEASTSP